MIQTEEQSDRAMDDLKDYIISHEDDIAIGINDFGDLQQVFIGVIGRQSVWINPRTKEAQS